MPRAREPGAIAVDLVAAARPNFMKVAPLHHALAGESWCTTRLVHTGQHYDPNMSDWFFRDLGIPPPDANLEVGGGTHAEQTGGVMIAYERLCLAARPDWCVVVGDVNSTLACTLAATKLGIKVAHLEAGLRSGDRRMPEEINRVATDALADLLWTPSPDADENLRREGVAAARIERVGNIMIDSLETMRPQIEARRYPAALGLPPGGYAVATLHRPSNVDEPAQLVTLVAQLLSAAAKLPLVFPVHPRTRKRLESVEAARPLFSDPRVRLIEPLGYIDFMSLVFDARLVITDSGGIQEETTYLGIPCLTLRDTTERPITVTEGTNRLVSSENLLASVERILAAPRTDARPPALWDGKTAPRVAASLRKAAYARP